MRFTQHVSSIFLHTEITVKNKLWYCTDDWLTVRESGRQEVLRYYDIFQKFDFVDRPNQE